MIKKIVLILLVFFAVKVYSQADEVSSWMKSYYVQLYGELFQQVQLSGMFKDSKTFVDAVPKINPDEIRELYDSIKTQPDFNLEQFVYANFNIPGQATDSIKFPAGQSMDQHIEYLWDYLIRKPDIENEYSTLLPLAYEYVVPGGRFREIYYWDSFFTILGLLANGKSSLAENMVNNFAFLIDTFQMIPNGNRVYYLTRSQPPFFALMIDIVCRYKKDYSWGLQFLPQLEKEYLFWMKGLDNIKENIKASENIAVLDDKGILNRYYDFDSIPREESYREDYLLAQNFTDTLKYEFYRNLRAAAESGWDFSSRWFTDKKSLPTINTTDILPVDLNCLIWFMEDRLAFFYELKEEIEKSELYRNKASLRAKLINDVFWNKEEGFYFDYNFTMGTQTNVYSLASCFPLYFGIAKPEQAEAVQKKLLELFLAPGGVLTTIYPTGQQWDAPNGWAPLQWMAIKGLREYGYDSLADTIKVRWLTLNENVFKRTGKMFEKYNVENLQLVAGGGEYPAQDGFGWTNGVAAALLENFDKIFLGFKGTKGH